MNSIVIGSRGSALALAQTKLMASQIRNLHPGLSVSIEIIKTTGDKLNTSPLGSLAAETKGLFVKEIEQSLLQGTIDLAVHSLKDLPTDLPEGLCLGATPERDEPWDALVSNRPLTSLADLPKGAVVGTSSLRRGVQIHSHRPDLKVKPIRGNIDTRIRKLRENRYDAIILAAAGLRRLKLEEQISYRFPPEEMAPAVGQGCLAIEIRTSDTQVMDIVQKLNHPATERCVKAERSFLEQIGGGCQLPLGAYAYSHPNQSGFFAFVASPSGSRIIKKILVGTEDELMNLVEKAVDEFKSQGSDELIREAHQ